MSGTESTLSKKIFKNSNKARNLQPSDATIFHAHQPSVQVSIIEQNGVFLSSQHPVWRTGDPGVDWTGRVPSSIQFNKLFRQLADTVTSGIISVFTEFTACGNRILAARVSNVCWWVIRFHWRYKSTWISQPNGSSGHWTGWLQTVDIRWKCGRIMVQNLCLWRLRNGLKTMCGAGVYQAK